MSALQTLRQNRAIVRRVLAWFVASLLVAGLAPVAQAAAKSVTWDSVCSAASPKAPTQGTGQAHGWSCSQCLPFVAPPPVEHVPADHDVAPSAVDLAVAFALVQSRSAAPLDARGPPKRS